MIDISCILLVYQIKEIFAEINDLYLQRINIIAQVSKYDIKLHSKPKNNDEKEIDILQMHVTDETGSIALIATHDINSMPLNTLFIFRNIQVTLIQNKLYLRYDNVSQSSIANESIMLSIPNKSNNNAIEDYSNIKLTKINFNSII